MKNIFITLILLVSLGSKAQQTVKITVTDNTTNETLANAIVRNTINNKTFITNNIGEIFLYIDKKINIEVSIVGYKNIITDVVEKNTIIALTPTSNTMQDVVITANRDISKRNETPVAIATLSSKLINETKATSIDLVLNKVSGVYMVNLGNEQHSMSIRQPMTTKSVFLYLEDGIPIRTTGIFNHNALLEINMAATKNIEVIKGPASSYYGSEAIGGVVNFTTLAPTRLPYGKLSLQKNNIGYNRVDAQTSYTKNNWGFALSGYYANSKNSYIDYSDFYKSTLTARVDYTFNSKINLINSLTYTDYYSDMSGGIDSIKYANKSFTSPNTFTYRKVRATRYRSTLTHIWNNNSKTTASVVYRKNSIGQNPSYLISDTYRRLANGTFVGKKDVANGQINESSFNSCALIAQHKQNINWKKAVFISGINIDYSPAKYIANYIKVKKDTLATSPTFNKYISYVDRKDSLLTNYDNDVNNYAAFSNFECTPIKNLRIVTSLRYDIFRYKFDNKLTPSSFSGAADTTATFKRFSPKIGATYNLKRGIGFYANYSEGFVPPQVTEMFSGVKVPDLKASIFYNYEIGGWATIIKDKLTTDFSLYSLDGTNEIVSVRLDDGTFANRNTGKTSHKGFEFSVNTTPIKSVSFRFSGAYSKHKFIKYVEKGISYNGKEMATAPNILYNAELWYRPKFIIGLRAGIELQKQGKYFMDPSNAYAASGFNSFNIRLGYEKNGAEIWINAINAFNKYYAYTSSRSAFGYNYTPAQPRNINVGLAYNFGKLLKRKYLLGYEEK
jgi:iron complex outermembrane recepter protein